MERDTCFVGDNRHAPGPPPRPSLIQHAEDGSKSLAAEAISLRLGEDPTNEVSNAHAFHCVDLLGRPRRQCRS